MVVRQTGCLCDLVSRHLCSHPILPILPSRAVMAFLLLATLSYDTASDVALRAVVPTFLTMLSPSVSGTLAWVAANTATGHRSCGRAVDKECPRCAPQVGRRATWNRSQKQGCVLGVRLGRDGDRTSFLLFLPDTIWRRRRQRHHGKTAARCVRPRRGKHARELPPSSLGGARGFDACRGE